MQSRRPFEDSYTFPFSSQSPPRGMHCLVNLRLGRFHDLRDHRPVCRIHIVELVLSGHEAAIDVVLD
jgi:hypothetical protein